VRAAFPRLLGAGLAAALLAAPCAAQGAAGKRPMTIDDFLALKVVSDPQLSPDGKVVAFTVSTPSLPDNKNIGKIWLAAADGSAVRQATAGGGSDRTPRWSPDGRTLAFLSSREGGSQVWRKPAHGGQASKVTSIPGGVSDFIWGRDGKSLYAVSDVKWPDTQEIDRRNGAFPTDARIWTGLFYRHWDEWRAGQRQHVFRVSLADGTATDLTPIDRDVPTLALGGKDLALSPPGTELAVVFNPDSNVATSTNNDIFVMGPDGSGRKPLTTNPANDHSPTYSPDGRYVAYLAMEVPGFEADRQQIMLYERATGRRSSLTSSWNLSVSSISWAPDTRSLIAEVDERGEQVLYRIEVPSGKRTKIVMGGVSSDVQIAPAGDFMVFLRQSATQPPEVWRAALDGTDLRPLTKINADALAKLDLGGIEPVGFVGAANDSVFGWVMKPPGFDQAKRYPLLYVIHGGPQSAWHDQWQTRWNYAMFAARGYVVGLVNFHGSTGYGQAFTNSISRNWGGAPYEDLMKGLDALAARPYVDRNRIGAAGASYGGYMIYWIAGHTNRFKVLVAHDGMFNSRSFAGSTEELWFPNRESGGSLESSPARATMEQWSPANFVENWSTPMLVVHGQKDYRVDVSEGYQAFTALKLRGVPSKFLYFPDEGHWVLKPRNRRLWWGTVLDWIDSYLSH
jgi:dipeptidyl aminopeptidase/acylaminoacyl peptidase